MEFFVAEILPVPKTTDMGRPQHVQQRILIASVLTDPLCISLFLLRFFQPSRRVLRLQQPAPFREQDPPSHSDVW